MKGFRVNKEKYIIKQIASNSNVLHVGCTNSPTTKRRWDKGKLLHKKLCDRANTIESHVTGIDIDEASIDFLKSKMPDEIILKVDAHNLSEYFKDKRLFDLIIAGEVIEHLPNPGAFLQSCNSVLSPGGRIIITTANAFHIVRFIKAMFFHEAVHPEHTAYYSHKTMSRLLNMCNMRGTDYGYWICESLQVSYSLNRLFSNLFENLICAFLPQFSEGIIVTGSKRSTI